MLDSALADQLRQHLTNIQVPIELVATLGDAGTPDPKATELPATRPASTTTWPRRSAASMSTASS